MLLPFGRGIFLSHFGPGCYPWAGLFPGHGAVRAVGDAEYAYLLLQKTLQRDVPLRAMFECRTVAELAEYIEGLGGNEIIAEKENRLSDLMAELEGV